MSQKTLHIYISQRHTACILIATGLFVGIALTTLFTVGCFSGYIGLLAAFGLCYGIATAFEQSEYAFPISSYVIGAVFGFAIQSLLT